MPPNVTHYKTFHHPIHTDLASFCPNKLLTHLNEKQGEARIFTAQSHCDYMHNVFISLITLQFTYALQITILQPPPSPLTCLQTRARRKNYTPLLSLFTDASSAFS